MRLSILVATAEGGLVPVGPLPRDPTVASVVTTDLLDPRRYLSGGELVLTGLAWWRPDQPGRSRGFVAALVGAGVAALAAGEAEFGGVPDDLVETCAEARLPLLRVPLAYSFASVTDRATRQLAGGDEVVELLRRHRFLIAAAAAREPGRAGLAGVLDLVERDLGVRCCVLAPTGRLVAAAAWAPDEKERSRLVRHHLRATRSPQSTGGDIAVLAAPEAAPRATAWLLAVESTGDGRPELVEELLSLVELERELWLRRSDREADLAAALVGGSADEVARALRTCGLDAAVPAAIVVGSGRHAVAILAELLAELLAEHPGGWALGEAADEALAVVADGSELTQRLRDGLALLAPGLVGAQLRIGVSDQVRGAAALLGAVAEARALAATAPPAGASVVGPERLSSHALLLAAVPEELRRAYRERVLGPLLEHDRLHRTDLVRTLAAYLECSGSWARCAAAMHLHVNTVRYRVERIELLTGRDLRRLQDQTDLLLALRL